MTVPVFGPEFSLEICKACALLSRPGLPVPPEWVLAKIALESGFDPKARNASGARGLWQKMPIASIPYQCPPPAQQIRDATQFWTGMARSFRVGGFRNREALYCLNLAPARLEDGRYDDETILYSANPEDHLRKYYWPQAYRQNARAFGLSPNDPEARLRMRHLAVGLDAAIQRHRARYDAEVASAYALNVRPPDAA